MKHRYSLLFAICVLLFSASKVSAAYYSESDTPKYKPTIPVYRDVVGDSAVIPKSRMKQQREFMEGTNLYPPKPRNEWEIGINGGGYFISGNVRTQGGGGFGATLQKAIGYSLSMKTLYFHGITYGLNFDANSGITNNPVLNGTSNKAINYANPPASYAQVFFYNYKNVSNELVEQLIFTVNNIGFHKPGRERRVNLYVGIGGGALEYRTWYNATDANGKMYNFSGLPTDAPYSSRKAVISDLKKLLDKTYETAAEGTSDQPGILKGTFRPVETGTIGLGFHLSRHFELSIMENATLTHDDDVDGDRWQEHPHVDPALVSSYDITHYVYANLGYFISFHKKSVEPLYWQNPMEYTYDALQTLMKKNVDDLIDTDDDGVVDRLDREPNSAPGAIVDTHGVTKDSDGDGIPDYKDKEPYSPPGVKVDSNGVTLPEYRPIVRNQLKNVIDSVYNGGGISVTGAGNKPPANNNNNVVNNNNNTIPIAAGGGAANNCNLTAFPTVNFDLDKFNIKPEFYAHLHEIAMAMIACPNQKMVAIGNTDVRETKEYNEVLSWERVNKCIEYIVNRYGINRDRFIVKFQGKERPLVPGLPDHGINPKFESQQYLNRRVEFHWAAPGETGDSNPPKPKGPKAAGKEW